MSKRPPDRGPGRLSRRLKHLFAASSFPVHSEETSQDGFAWKDVWGWEATPIALRRMEASRASGTLLPESGTRLRDSGTFMRGGALKAGRWPANSSPTPQRNVEPPTYARSNPIPRPWAMEGGDAALQVISMRRSTT